MNTNEKIAVIDTETTWKDKVMSIGVVIADASDFCPVESRYYVFDPEYKEGGFFSAQLFMQPKSDTRITTRKDALDEIGQWITAAGVKKLFAYNGGFDKGHLAEFSDYDWHDIMKIAAYRQYNKSIPDCAECCGTGRLKRNYGVEPITRMLSGDRGYCETHNALQDALDELDIMRMLCLGLETYDVARI